MSSSLSIATLFCLLVFGAFKASHKSPKNVPLSLLSNGSHQFEPTTILISLDGFRADFLQRNITPTLNSFIEEGISPKYMLPSFPSVTFPNHYTLATGLYPESHGVVGNTFWDPELEAEFYYTDPTRSMHPKWWQGGEPLWVTAERQNVRTAIHMWPGSEAHLLPEPTYLDAYNGEESLPNKVDRIFQLLDLPNTGPKLQVIERPQFIAAYVPVVDADGHKYGPNSTEIQNTIASVDSMLLNIFNGLAIRNLTNIVNIVLVSDHGMATTSIDRLIQLDDLIDLNLVSHMDGWPLYGLRPKNASDLLPLYETLLAAQSPNFEVYLRDVNMPERYHFSHNPRIAPLWLVPKTGWAIVHKADFDVSLAKERGETYHPKGLHGYDHEHPLMRAIFVARGPAFPHVPNSRVENFQNTEVYNIVCDSLGIEPRPNNGTLRLPLVPIGLHSDDVHDETSAIAEDFLGDQHTANSPSTLPTDSSISSPSSATTAADAATTASPLSIKNSTLLTLKNNTLLSTPGGKDDETTKTIWDNLIAKLEEAKAWLGNLVSTSSEKQEG